MPQSHEWTKIWHNSQLDVDVLQAYYVEHAFPRHSHDYYVISLVKRGFQSFLHKGSRYYTPAGGIILINPDTAHTGEAVNEQGFEMLCVYPTTLQMQKAVFELTGHHQRLPFFKDVHVRVDHPWAAESILALHKALIQGTSPMECESLFTWTLAQLIKHFADIRLSEVYPGRERKAVQQARRYIDEYFASGINLTDLAELVSLSPYYLLRVFRADVGMPPYAYLESVRIRQAQRLIEASKPLAEVAIELGFSSQSHLTQRFKQIIGVTPGQYARQIRES